MDDFDNWFMLLSKVPYMSQDELARRAFDAGQLTEREACMREADAAAMPGVPATKGLKLEDAGQLTAYRNGWSHGALEAAERIRKRSNVK